MRGSFSFLYWPSGYWDRSWCILCCCSLSFVWVWLTSESLEHLSFYCPLAHSVLSWLQSSPLAPSLICRRALFSFSSDELLFVYQSFVYILGVFKLFIWHARNDFAFAIFVLGLLQSSRMLKLMLALIFLSIPKVCIFKRRNFHRQWGGCGAVASVVRGCLVLQLHLLGPNLGLCLSESGQLLHGPNLDVKPLAGGFLPRVNQLIGFAQQPPWWKRLLARKKCTPSPLGEHGCRP